MITALEAREGTQQTGTIEYRIRQAMERGFYSANFNKLPTATIKELRNAGYKVTVYSTTTIVEW